MSDSVCRFSERIKTRQTSPASIIVLMLWTLLPLTAMWLGLYIIRNAVWTIAIYHCICLVPALIRGRALWRSSLCPPSLRDCIAVGLAAVLANCIAVLGYELIGAKLLSNEQVVGLLNQQGCSISLFYPLSIYFVVVNPVLEEIFWRGVVFNQLDKLASGCKYFGIAWSSVSYAVFHYLIFRLILFPGFAELGIFLLALYGALLALVYRRTGSILTTALVHGLTTDLPVIVLILDLYRLHPSLF